MKTTDKDSLGDRMKEYESATTSRRAFKGQPLVVRLDGKSFHTFTRGLSRPYEAPLSALMVSTMLHLVDILQAKIGYTQSDEITLVFLSKAGPTEPDLPYKGRIQKMESLSASIASVYFNKKLPQLLPTKAHLSPVFDSRAFVVPSEGEAYNEVLWRQQDATKNAISMAAQSMFKHSELQHKSGTEMQEMMFAQRGVNFNDYPYFFKRGTFGRRVTVMKELTPELLSKIPEAHRPTGPVERSEVVAFDCWLQKQDDPVATLFHNGPLKVVDAAPDAS